MRINIYFNEFKCRVFYVGVSIFFSSVLIFSKLPHVFSFILFPLKSFFFFPKSVSLICFDMTELFLVQVYITLFLSAFVSIPMIWFHTWLFFKPSFYANEAEMFKNIVLLSHFFMLLAILSTHFLFIPQLWSFFLNFNFQIGSVENTSINYFPGFVPYLSLVIETYFSVILSSQLPIAFFICLRWEVIEKKFLWCFRSWVFFILLVWSTIVSPPDLGSQIFVFVPLVFLYEFFIVVFFIRQSLKTLYLEDKSKICKICVLNI